MKKILPSSSYAFICGLIITILGTVVMLGWYTHNISLIQIMPTFAPMQYNTALCFLLCGLGLIFLLIRQNILSGMISLPVLILSGLTLSQYILESDFGIDQFMMDDYTVMTKASHAGRMAPNTALCFLLTSFALLSAQRRLVGTTCAASAVFIMAALALSGYLIQEDSIYGWGNLTRMAIHTATGFIIISSGLALFSIRRLISKNEDLWQLAPSSVTTIMLVLTFFAWYAVKESAAIRNQGHFKTLVTDMQNSLNNRYDLYEQSLRGGLGLFYASNKIVREEWRVYVDTLKIKTTLPGINGIGYINYVFAQDIESYIDGAQQDDSPTLKNYPTTFYPDKFVIRYIEPLEENSKAVGLDIGFEPHRRAAAERARDLGVPALTKKIILVQDNKKQPGFLLLLPVYDSHNIPSTIEQRRAEFRGWVYAPFIGVNFLTQLGPATRNQVAFTVYDGERAVSEALIYDGSRKNQNKFHHTETTQVKIAGRIWTIEWQATDEFVPISDQSTAKIALIAGALLSLFLYIMLAQLIRRKQIIIDEVQRQTATIKLNEIALQASEEQFRSAMEYSAIGIALVSKEGKWLKANKALTGILGYTEEELLQIDFQSITHPEDLEKDLNLIKEVLDKKRDSYQMEKRYFHKDGHIIWALLSVSMAWNTDGTPKYFISQILDITDRKEADKERDLLMQALSKSNEDLERFAYVASHDLQEPLRMVRSFTGLLADRYADTLDETAQEYVSFAHSSAKQMQDLVDDLLEYSRIGSEAEKYEEVNCTEILGDVLENLQERIAATDAQVSHNDLPIIHANPVRIMRVFQNLVGNGIKYQAPGNTPEMSIAAQDQEEFWLFSFMDNGIGIKEDYRDKIFEPFKRLHGKTEYYGTGMGLAICKKIIEDFGGKIWVESAPNGGCVFNFTIPKHAKEEKKDEL